MSWLTRLFRRRPTLVGTRMHAWHWTEWGRSRVVGEVIGQDDHRLLIDPSNPTTQEWKAIVGVWRHDARPLGEDLPVDVGPID